MANQNAGSNYSYATSTNSQNTYFGDTVGNDKQSDKTWDTVGIVIIALLTSVIIVCTLFYSFTGWLYWFENIIDKITMKKYNYKLEHTTNRWMDVI